MSGPWHIAMSVETLSLGPNPFILGIGAVAFNPWEGEKGVLSLGEDAFHWISPIENDDQSGGVISKERIRWLAIGPTPELRKRLAMGGRTHGNLVQALDQLDQWLWRFLRSVEGCDGFWCRPLGRLEALRSAAGRVGSNWRIPSGLWRDFTTLAAVGELMDVEAGPFVGCRHDPLDEAFDQAGYAIRVLRKVKGLA